jgi:ATP-binding cassette, subfamily F, member 3
MSFGGRDLWRDVTFRLLPGRRVALVGGNGTGKTTLLECLVNHQRPNAGDVFVESGARVGYLPQDLPGDQHGTVLEEVLAGADQIASLAHRLTELEHLLATATGEAHQRAIDEYGTVQSRFETLGGYAIEAEAHRLLAGLGFRASQIDRPVPELSGGWRMRAALARLLLSAPDVLLLDEPTNHLDVDSVAWLENYLHDWNGALLFVSHDRDFIDGVASHIIELAEGTALEYTGGFAEFVVQREERLERIGGGGGGEERRGAKMARVF